MRLRVIAVGRLKEDYLKAAVADYTARIKPYAQLELVEVAGLPDPTKPSPALAAQVREREAALLLRQLQEGETLVALDPAGRSLSSEELAAFLRPYEVKGAHMAFVIGGSLGLGRTLLDRADAIISLSRLTFPHGLARLILLEQLYRTFKIMRGETYHK